MNPPHALLTGWIFDTYPTNGGMVVWIVDEAGKSHRLTDPFQPSFYAAGPVKALRQLAADLARLHLAAPVGMTHRTEFWSGDLREVLEFRLLDPERQPALLRRLAVPRPGHHPLRLRPGAGAHLLSRPGDLSAGKSDCHRGNDQ